MWSFLLITGLPISRRPPIDRSSNLFLSSFLWKKNYSAFFAVCSCQLAGRKENYLRVDFRFRFSLPIYLIYPSLTFTQNDFPSREIPQPKYLPNNTILKRQCPSIWNAFHFPKSVIYISVFLKVAVKRYFLAIFMNRRIRFRGDIREITDKHVEIFKLKFEYLRGN